MCFRGGQTGGCFESPTPKGAASSLILHSHRCLPRAAASAPSLRSLTLRRASDANLCRLRPQQLNCDSDGTCVWLPRWLSTAYCCTIRPKGRSVRNWGLHQVPRGRCGASKCSLCSLLLGHGSQSHGVRRESGTESYYVWLSGIQRAARGPTAPPEFSLGLLTVRALVQISSVWQIGTTCR